VGIAHLLALQSISFASFEQPFGAYFSPFVRTTQFAIRHGPLPSLRRKIPPAFALHSQAVLLLSLTSTTPRGHHPLARPVPGCFASIDTAVLHVSSGPAVPFSLAATGGTTFCSLFLRLLICLSSARALAPYRLVGFRVSFALTALAMNTTLCGAWNCFRVH